MTQPAALHACSWACQLTAAAGTIRRDVAAVSHYRPAELTLLRCCPSVCALAGSFAAEMDEKHSRALRQMADGCFDPVAFDAAVAARLRCADGDQCALLHAFSFSRDSP